MSSLRARLIAGLLAGITLFLAVDGVVIYAVVRTRLQSEQDRSLESVARSVAPTLFARARSERHIDPPPGPPPPLPETFTQGGYLLASWLEDGTPLWRSPGLEEGVLERPPRKDGSASFGDARLEDGAPLRVVHLELRAPAERPGPPPRGGRPFPPRPPPIEVSVATGSGELASTLRQLRWLLALTWITSSLGCAAVLSWLVHRGLKPIDRLRRQIDAVDESRLGQRFELPGAPTELTPVVERLNALVARLAAAFEREQAFTAHAAHELRTPLAGLRSTLEVELSRPRSVEEHRVAAQQCLEVTLQMQTLAERLLELARLEARTDRGAPCEVAIPDLVRECWETCAGEVAARGVALDLNADPGLVFATDAELLRQVLRNLVENAVGYAPAGERVEVVAQLTQEGLVVRITNAAPDAPPELPERAFEPFWRADAARSATGVHAGLGLALCERIVDLLGGSLRATLGEGRFTVELRLPPPVAAP